MALLDGLLGEVAGNAAVANLAEEVGLLGGTSGLGGRASGLFGKA